MRVRVGRDLQRDALVQRPAGDPVEVAARHLEDRDAGVRRQVHGLGDPLVGGGAEGDVQRGGRDPRAQALDDRVAAEHGLGAVAVVRRRVAAGRPRSPPVDAACLAAEFARRCAGWPLRISAGGVGPLPCSARRRWPPEPTTIPSSCLLCGSLRDGGSCRPCSTTP